MESNPITYRGFEIHCVFKYSDGRGDFNVFYPEADYGYIAPNTKIESIEAEIDSYYDQKLAEHE